MRAFAFVSAISLAAPMAAAAPPPQRVASLNLCTDELLLLIGDPGRTVSVTHLAHQEAETPLWRLARRYPRNDGSLLSVTRLRPDLILTMGGGGRDRLRIASRLGIRTLDLPFAQSLDDVERSVGAVADALGRRAAGAALIARIRQLRRTAPPRAADSIWLGGGGRTVAATGLEARWMRLAGLAQRSVRGDRVSLEQLAVRPPAILLRSDYRAGQYSGAQRWLRHPLARSLGRSRTVPTDGRRWTCMGPLLVDEIHSLRAVLAR